MLRRLAHAAQVVLPFGAKLGGMIFA